MNIKAARGPAFYDKRGVPRCCVTKRRVRTCSRGVVTGESDGVGRREDEPKLSLNIQELLALPRAR